MADPHDATAHTLTTHTHTHAATTGQGVNDHHAKNHTMAEHEAMGRMVVIRKTADETISLNQVSQNDDELFFAVGTNEVWVFTCVLIYNSGTVEDFKFNATGPAGSAGFHALVGTNQLVVALGTDSGTVNSAAADRVIAITGVIENGGTAGNLNIMWAQALSGVTNCIVREHSYLIAHRVT